MSILPKYYRISDYGVICDPIMSVKSDKTQDMYFFEFANNYELQVKIKLGSCVFINPSEQYAERLTENDLYEAVAEFIASFKLDEEQRKLVYNHLMTNPIIRVITN